MLNNSPNQEVNSSCQAIKLDFLHATAYIHIIFYPMPAALHIIYLIVHVHV